MGFKHHICTPENPAANGFMEVFQKVLVKLVHTAIIEGKDPARVVQEYLVAYKAAPHKLTGKSLYELMFNRKMQTKLPQLEVKKHKDMDKAVREKHEKEKERQKKYHDEKKKGKEKEIKKGDKILIQRKKTTEK